MVMWMTLAAILRRGAFTCAGLFLLTACGVRPPAGFANHTHHTDAQLRALWETAQQNLSQQIDLNPLQRVFQNVQPNIRPGDARGWEIAPRQLEVAYQEDVPGSGFYAATGNL